MDIKERLDIDERLAAVAKNEGLGTLWFTDEGYTIGKELLLPLLEAYESSHPSHTESE